MELFYRDEGNGYPILILHGLYGSSDNWMSIAKQLSSNFRVIAVDQRNHGHSPHSSTHTYKDLTDDLLEFVDRLNLEQFHLLGHSMGGRVAMLFQSLYSSRVKSLIVVDVAPWPYTRHDHWFLSSIVEHETIINAMLNLPLQSINSRQDADELLGVTIKPERLRQFLLKNLRRNADNQFYWSLNLPILAESLDSMLLGVDIDKTKTKDVNVLFVKGEESNYIPKDKVDVIYQYYPRANVVSIQNAGHWVHAEQPNVFMSKLLGFLENS